MVSNSTSTSTNIFWSNMKFSISPKTSKKEIDINGYLDQIHGERLHAPGLKPHVGSVEHVGANVCAQIYEYWQPDRGLLRVVGSPSPLVLVQTFGQELRD